MVIDEADEMLSKGFKEQIYDIYRHLPPHTQIVLISATLPPDVLSLTQQFMTEPVRILVKRDELTLEGIKQFFISVDKGGVEVRHAVPTCTTYSPSLSVSYSSTRRPSATGSSTRCVQHTSLLPACMATCHKQRESG